MQTGSSSVLQAKAIFSRSKQKETLNVFLPNLHAEIYMLEPEKPTKNQILNWKNSGALVFEFKKL